MLSEPVVMPVEKAPSALTAMLLTAVQVLGQELDVVRHEAGPEVSARLAGAEDELAAIHDEMRQQQQEISELLAGADSDRAVMLRRFLSALPLATLLTNATGKILEANGAAHAALQISVGGLIGKPVFAYIAQGDRRRLRSVLSQACVGDELLQASAQVSPRQEAAVNLHFALVREVNEHVAAVARSGSDVDSLTARPPDSLRPGGGPLELGGRSPEPGGEAELLTLQDATELTPPLVRWVILPDYEAVNDPPSHQQLEALTRLCRLGVDAGDLRSVLGQVARLCQQAVVEADHVSLLVGNPLEPTMTIASSAVAQHLDGLQHVRAGGPSFDAFRSRRPIALDGEMVTEHQGLAGDKQAQEVRSLLALPLVADDRPSGVLTVYASGEKSVATLVTLRQVLPFVEAAQTLLRDTRAHEEMLRTQEQLEAALISRAVIDQAKGMIMISLKCSADDAFGHLVRMSSTRHEKVRDVAQNMVDDALKKRSRSSANPSE